MFTAGCDILLVLRLHSDLKTEVVSPSDTTCVCVALEKYRLPEPGQNLNVKRMYIYVYIIDTGSLDLFGGRPESL